MRHSVQENFVAFSTQYEGRVNYMYVDVKDLVTIGIGNLIDPIGLALPLPFVLKSDQATPASPEDIAADWNAVKGDPSLAQRGHRACEPITSLMLTDEGIDELVLSKLDQFAATLKGTTEFADLEDWPADAQLGLFSMAWAMGPAFAAANRWPGFRAACASHDWISAAENCKMNDAGNPGLEPRNVADRVLFVNAANTGDPETLQYTVSGERPSIKTGASGDSVSFLQTRLSALGFDVAVTGTFDEATVDAVKHFQQNWDLDVDGAVGPSTWAALGTSIAAP